MESVTSVLQWLLDHWDSVGAAIAAIIGLLAARKNGKEAKALEEVAVANAVAVETVSITNKDVKAIAETNHLGMSADAQKVVERVVGLAETAVAGYTKKNKAKPALEVLGKVLGVAKKLLLVLCLVAIVACVTTAPDGTVTKADVDAIRAIVAEGVNAAMLIESKIDEAKQQKAEAEAQRSAAKVEQAERVLTMLVALKAANAEYHGAK